MMKRLICSAVAVAMLVTLTPLRASSSAREIPASYGETSP